MTVTSRFFDDIGVDDYHDALAQNELTVDVRYEGNA